MNKKKFQRVISLVLALLFVASSATISVFAEDVLLSTNTGATTGVNSSITDSTIDDVREILGAVSYAEYFEKYSERVEVTDENGFVTQERVWTVDAATDTITIDAVEDLYEEGTDAA